MKNEVPEDLWVKAVDGLLSDEEKCRFDAFMDEQPELRKDLQMDLEIKMSTDALTQRILQDAKLSPPRPSIGVQASRQGAFAVLASGAAVLLGFGGYAWFTIPDLPLWAKLGVGLSGLGLMALIVPLVKARLAGSDPYQEIDR